MLQAIGSVQLQRQPAYVGNSQRPRRLPATCLAIRERLPPLRRQPCQENQDGDKR
jgi:hypothetical protein